MRNWEKFNEGVVEEFRANGGMVKGRSPLLLLTTIGARTGLPRIAPLVYAVHGANIVLIASKAGEPTNPDWFHNLIANPDVIVELGTDRFAARARVAEGDERNRLFTAIVKAMYRFGNYQRKTNRIIPVVVLERSSASSTWPSDPFPPVARLQLDVDP